MYHYIFPSIYWCMRLSIYGRLWWRHQIETISALLGLSEGNTLFTNGFHSQRPVAPSFDVFFDLHLKKRLSKQSRLWRFETPSLPQCTTLQCFIISYHIVFWITELQSRALTADRDVQTDCKCVYCMLVFYFQMITRPLEGTRPPPMGQICHQNSRYESTLTTASTVEGIFTG